MHAWHVVRALILITLTGGSWSCSPGNTQKWQNCPHHLSCTPLPELSSGGTAPRTPVCCVFLDSTPLLHDLWPGFPALRLSPVAFNPEPECRKRQGIQSPNLLLNICVDCEQDS